VMRSQYEHAIVILIGKPPAEFALAPAPLNLEPPVIPVGVPSQLLERRPDIAIGERRVGEANEGIGIALAALSATGGLEGNSIANWFTWPSRFWAVGPSMLLETIFDGGRRRATSEGARANYDTTVANCRQTALVAFQEVEDNLAAWSMKLGSRRRWPRPRGESISLRIGTSLAPTPTFRLSPLRRLSYKTSGTRLTSCDAAWTRAFS
jgi:outer membrane protein TolC